MIGAKVGAFVLYALPKAVTVITIQLGSGFTGIGLDGSTLSKDAAQSRIQNGFANLTATSIGFGLYQLAQTNNYGNVQGSVGNESPKTPVSGAEWEQYFKQAQSLTDSNSANVLTKTRPNGDTIFYKQATNEFAVTDSSGSIRTYFKPTDGIDYFNRQ